MGTDFEVSVTLPLPRLALWYLRGTARFHEKLVAQGALSRMACGPARRADGAGASAQSREYVYVPKEMEIPDAVKAVFNDTFLEIRDRCAWDDGLCEADERHARGEGDLCLARMAGGFPGEEPEDVGVAEVKVANEMRRCYSQNFVITPGVLAQVVETTGSLTLYEDEKDGRLCRHVLKGRCEVAIPLLGWYIEAAIIGNMETFYKNYEGHIVRLRDELLGSEDSSEEEMVQKAKIIYEEDLNRRALSTDGGELTAAGEQKSAAEEEVAAT